MSWLSISPFFILGYLPLFPFASRPPLQMFSSMPTIALSLFVPPRPSVLYPVLIAPVFQVFRHPSSTRKEARTGCRSPPASHKRLLVERRLTLHASLRTPHGVSARGASDAWLVDENSTHSAPALLVRVQGDIVLGGHAPYEYTLPPPRARAVYRVLIVTPPPRSQPSFRPRLRWRGHIYFHWRF